MTDNWRIEIELPEEGHASSLLDRLGLDLGSDEAKRLAKELEGHRLAVSRDDDVIFVYAESQAQAEQARRMVDAELADTLEREGFDVVRRWRFLIVGAGTEEQARELARRVHGEAEPGGEVVWEVAPQNPFALFGGLGS